ncbi:MAG: NAD(P)/FAD-dependent oxidoreductase [Deltaproteobacteria bacterium]|nr:NAD(P)/FAD-dependent oxidoreductase [Deltaproteobacteria bacterium]
MAASPSFDADVLVIGAGPAGSAASVALVRQSHKVVCLERGHFPRQVVGESLLPRANDLLAGLGLLDAVERRGYMVKKGALFLRGDERERFSFANALEGDRPTTFQVPRDDFDQTLATEARRQGVDVRFGQEVLGASFADDGAAVTVKDLWKEQTQTLRARWVLDCSGYGRVLARLLKLDEATGLPARVACFTHFEGDVRPRADVEGDIWVCCHPDNGWLWLIPFSNGRTSVGMVCDPAYWDALHGTSLEKLLTQLQRDPNAAYRLRAAQPVLPPQILREYSTKNSKLHGTRWAVAGNAGDFLDPVFSSGVTLALESATLSAALVDRCLRGEAVDWDASYTGPMAQAVAVFRAMVNGWYDGQLPDIFFNPQKLARIKSRFTSLLGGYVRRADNPLTRDCARSIASLHAAIASGMPAL